MLALLLLAAHPWKPTATERLPARFPPPPGYARVEEADGSFGAWLRTLPVLDGRGTVKLHDGRDKANQAAHVAVLDVDLSKKDLQQCADAVMRLRAEYLWASGQADRVCFRFTSGHAAWWSKWREGQRPEIRGNKVRFPISATPDAGYANFRAYLETIFTYAGSHSLAKELGRVDDPRQVAAGDVFIKGGFPGHAVLVLDVAKDARGERVFLLGQSYMPAQQIHVLANPRAESPWYAARRAGTLETPEWRFDYTDLRRFGSKPCAGGAR